MKAIIVTGDWHVGSTVGLCPLAINLDDGGTYHASPGQRWLWRNWLDTWDWFTELSKGYERIAVLNGDLGEADAKRRSNQVITRNKATVLKMMIEVAAPLQLICDRIYINRGTEAHAGKSAELEEEFASDCLNAVQSPDGLYSWWHLRLNACGVRLDIAHHANMGSKPWTEANAANSLAVETLNWYARMDQKPPHVVLRSHVHRTADSFDNYATRAVFVPSWQLATAYIHRIGHGNRLADIGAVAILCDGGHYEIHKRFYKPDKGKNVWATQA